MIRTFFKHIIYEKAIEVMFDGFIGNLKTTSNEDGMWEWIQFIGWGIHKDLELYKIKMDVIVPENEIKSLKQFSILKRRQLQIKYDLGGSDSYWDLCAHVVGLGKEEYYKCLNDYDYLMNRYERKDYKENFEYIFSD